MPSLLPPPRTPTTASVLADPNLPEVVQLMSYRKGIQGRATVVLRVREVTPSQAVPEPEPETQGGVDTAEGVEETEVPDSRGYVLKLMWRESEKRSEGGVMEKLVGIYGLAQYLWHSNVLKAKQCLDAMLDQDEGSTGKNLTNLDIVLDEEDGKEVEYYPGDYSTMHPSCPKRVYCQPLMSTVGEPLWVADSPRNLLEAVLGAILGYWSIFNEGMLCQDMNDGNVLMLQGGQRFDCRKRKVGLVETRTGTPTFMSSRVLDIPVGVPSKGRVPLIVQLVVSYDLPAMRGTRIQFGSLDPKLSVPNTLNIYRDLVDEV
ncbi:hypothetical protein FRC10_003859, partial [Ceratobasidium sp. 414]